LLYLNLNANLGWTHYIFNYTAPNATTATISFAFRNDPNYWYLDAVSVTNSSGQQLLLNGGFELNSGSLVDWVYCNPQGSTNPGSVSGANPHSGSYSYEDGSTGALDYLSQTFHVQLNGVYTVSFWLTSVGTSDVFALITISA
jgi:hypothetical protein